MTNEKLESLAICQYCSAIGIHDKPVPSWLSEKDDAVFYKALSTKYREVLSHGICEPCLDERYPEKTKGRILIADDEVGIRELIADYLNEVFPKYEIEVFENGTDLKNRLEGLVGKETDVKLVITDNHMSGYKGSELIVEYALKIKLIPMILVSGEISEIGKLVMKKGACGYMGKPFQLEPFAKFVAQVLGERK